MSLTPQAAVQKFKSKFPGQYDEYTEEQIYRHIRKKYPAAQIDDWPEIGYTTKKPDDEYDQYLTKTDEDSFLDHFSMWGGREDSYISQLTYLRSLQGMASDMVRGKAKFKLERQPAIWEEALAGVLAYTQPLDFATLFLGGGVASKAVMSTGAAKQQVAKLAGKVAKRFPSMSKNDAAKGIASIVGSEMMYVPYEAAKANINARVAHIRNPETFKEPLSSSQIWKETFQGVGHGAIMGVLGGSARPFIAAKHSRVLRQIDDLNVRPVGPPKQIFKLKDQLKYTGKLGEYASEVVGLTAGDIVGTGVAYGQLKSWEESLATLGTMTGFVGVTKLASAPFKDIANNPLEKSLKKYEQDWKRKKDEVESLRNVEENISRKSVEDLDSDVESKAQDNSMSIEDLGAAAEAAKENFKDTKYFKQYQKIKSDIERFESMREKFVEKGTPLTGKQIGEFYAEKSRQSAEINAYIKDAGYENYMTDINDMNEFIDNSNQRAMRAAEKQQTSVEQQFIDVANELEVDGKKTVRMLVKDGEKNTPKQVYLNDVPDEVRKANPNFTEEQIMGESLSLISKNLDKIKQRNILSTINDVEVKKIITSNNKSVDFLQKRLENAKNNKQLGLTKSYTDVIDRVNKIDEKIANIEQRVDLDTKAKESYKENLLLARTFISDKLPLYTSKSGGSAGKLLDAKSRSAYIDTVEEFVDFLLDEDELVNAGSVNPELIKSFTASLGKKTNKQSGMALFYRYLKSKDLLTSENKGIEEELFGTIGFIDEVPKIGLLPEEIIINPKNPDDIKLQVSASKSGGRAVGLNPSQSKAKIGSKSTYGVLMKSVLDIAKRFTITAEDIVGQKNVLTIPFFAKKWDKGKAIPMAISRETLTNLIPSIMGSKITPSMFRKGFSSWAAKKYGVESKQIAVIDLFGLGHLSKAEAKKVRDSYIDDMKINKDTGQPKNPEILKLIKDLQQEYADLIHDGNTSSKLETMTDTELSNKYNLMSGEGLDLATGTSIYRVKKGLEKIAVLAEGADDDGFINFNNKGQILDLSKKANLKQASISIHKNTLEGLVRTLQESSLRINDIVAEVGNLEGVPVIQKGKAIQSNAVNTLVTKLAASGLNIKPKTIDNLGPDNKNISPKSDISEVGSLQNVSGDSPENLINKIKVNMKGGPNGNISRDFVGDFVYEKNLVDMLDGVLSTADLKKFKKKPSLKSSVLNRAVLDKIAKKIDCN